MKSILQMVDYITNGKTKNHLQQIQEIKKVGFPVSNDQGTRTLGKKNSG